MSYRSCRNLLFSEHAAWTSSCELQLAFVPAFQAIVPRANPLSQRAYLKLDDFQGQNMLFLDGSWAAVDLINLQNKIIKLNDQLNVTYASDLSSLNILIKSGQGIAVGLYCIYAELSKDLTYVPLDWEPTVDLVMITPKKKHQRLTQEFIKFIQQANQQRKQKQAL